MKSTHMVLLCILGAALVSTVICSSDSIGPDDCCFSFYPRRVRKDLIRSYYTIDPRCPKPAVILVTQKSRRLCMDPSLAWVQNIMKYLDEQSL